MPITLDGTNTSTFSGDVQVGGSSTNVKPLISGSVQNSTSGTSIDFTGIPSWARRVTVIFNGVSTTGSSDILVQLGTGSTPTTSGYNGGQTVLSFASGVVNSTSSAGIPVYNNAATYAFYGQMVLLNITGNTWVASGLFVSTTGNNSTVSSGGSIALSSSLGMVRITTASGTPTFDAGSINILYE